MKNLLTLHEAVAVVLLSQPNRASTFQTIADEIESRNLFAERKGGITLSEQIKLRTSIHQVDTNSGLILQNLIS